MVVWGEEGEKRSGAEAPVPISSSWAAVFWRQLEGTIQSRNREKERKQRGKEVEEERKLGRLLLLFST